jgi:hypothetical protein
MSVQSGVTKMTTMLCPRCGGAISPPRDYRGRTCTCDHGGAATSSQDAASTTAGHKFCCACGSEVTHARRMKDHEGRYWCYECGAADLMKKNKSLTLRCPACLRSFPPAQMIKSGEEYVCSDCLPRRKGHSRARATAGPASQVNGFALGFGLVLGVAGAVLIVLYYMDLL